jgi:hypothetical protein
MKFKNTNLAQKDFDVLRELSFFGSTGFNGKDQPVVALLAGATSRQFPENPKKISDAAPSSGSL